MQIHQIKRTKKRKMKRIVGRGGKHAKTSGRGTKGQRSRAGRKLRPEMRDIIKKLPKLRGRGKNSLKSFQKIIVPIQLHIISSSFSSGDTVNLQSLVKKGVVKIQKGKFPRVKILGGGEITKKINFSGILVSQKAKDHIEKAGGKIK